jgi:hypothetical protein
VTKNDRQKTGAREGTRDQRRDTKAKKGNGGEKEKWKWEGERKTSTKQ